jgi:hypothetical protein
MGPHLKQAVRGLSEVTMSRFAVAGMEPRASPILAKCPPLSCMPSPELELLNSSRKLAVAMKLPVQLCAFQFECSLIFSYQARKGGYRDVRPPREPHRVISVLMYQDLGGGRFCWEHPATGWKLSHEIFRSYSSCQLL